MVTDQNLRKRRQQNLKTLLSARSIVFIGGRSIGPAMNYCRELGFSGAMHVVNPLHESIGGVPCVAGIEDLRQVPDAAWIALPPSLCVDTVRDLSAVGVAGAVCYSAGFAEIGAVTLQTALAEAAGDMALLGPNTIGMVNYCDRMALMADSHGQHCPEAGIACISQSGTIGANMVMSDRSLPITHIISLGNQVCIDVADAIAALLEDDRVRGFAVYLEGLIDASAFAEVAAKAFDRNKPLVCLQVGQSEAGRQSAMSHTGKMVSAPQFNRAFLRRLGIIQVDNFPQLIEVSKLFAAGRAPSGRRLVIETASGMDTGYCADLAQQTGICLPQPDADLCDRLRRILPEFATPRNPLDVTMAQWGDREAQARSLVTLAGMHCDAAAIVVNAPSTTRIESFDAAFLAAADAQAQLDCPCYVITNLPEGAPKLLREKLQAAGVVTLQGIEDAFASLAHAGRAAERHSEIQRTGGIETRLVGTGTTSPASQNRALSETESKQRLAAAGLAIPSGRAVSTASQAVAAAREIGFPVVIKATGGALLHKTESNAVVLDLRDETDVAAAATRLLDIEGADGLLVEEFVRDCVAELIVGVSRDPVLGLVVTIGAGGVLAELLDDTQSLVLPVRRCEIETAIQSLRVASLIRGWRGRQAGDMAALISLIERVGEFAEQEAGLLIEMEINPVIVRPQGAGAVVVDALIVDAH